MSGRGLGVAGRMIFMGALAIFAASCGSSDDGLEALEPLENETEAVTEQADEPAPETTATTEAETTTEVTLSELALAEAEIEATIQSWWAYPLDTSLGPEGLPLEFLTDLMYQRVEELGQTQQAEGQILRSQGTAMIRVADVTVDLAGGTAEADVCSLADGELVDAETGEVLAVDEDQAYTGVIFAKKVEDVWKLSEFVTSQAGDNPEQCDI